MGAAEASSQCSMGRWLMPTMERDEIQSGEHAGAEADKREGVEPESGHGQHPQAGGGADPEAGKPAPTREI